MASLFKSSVAPAVGTSDTTLLTTTGISNVVIGMSLANIKTVTVYASVKVTRNSVTVYAGKNLPVPPGSTIALFGGDQKMVMMTGDVLKVISDTADSIDVILSYMETTL
jgi:hypothetical protein